MEMWVLTRTKSSPMLQWRNQKYRACKSEWRKYLD
jgi:hypothetical protein